MNQPHRCPVCSGRGIVTCDFYNLGMNMAEADPIKCRSCSGAGVLWEPGTPSAWFPPAPLVFGPNPLLGLRGSPVHVPTTNAPLVDYVSESPT